MPFCKVAKKMEVYPHPLINATNHYLISLVIRQSFSLPKQSKKVDASSKMDLDFWDCLGRAKLIL